MSKPRVVKGTMRVRAYPVLLAAVAAGVGYGWARAHKHVDNPSAQAIRTAIEEAVLGQICEAFDFPDDDAGGGS